LLLDKVPPTQNASASNEESMCSTLSAQVNSFLPYMCTMQNVRQIPRFQDLSRQGWSSLECACALDPSRHPHFHLIISSHDAKINVRVHRDFTRAITDDEWWGVDDDRSMMHDACQGVPEKYVHMCIGREIVTATHVWDENVSN
jgi:hypothetical protein